MIEYFEHPDGLGPVNGYSHAASGAGRLVAVSGQLPVNDRGVIVDATDGLAQARQVFANLGSALAAAGARRQDLLRLTFSSQTWPTCRQFVTPATSSWVTALHPRVPLYKWRALFFPTPGSRLTPSQSPWTRRPPIADDDPHAGGETSTARAAGIAGIRWPRGRLGERSFSGRL